MSNLFAAAITGGLIGGIVSMVQFVVNRRDKKNDDTKAINEKLDKVEIHLHKLEMDSVRLQLMNLIYQNPNSIVEIMKCAEHYFNDLKGDWYMTSIFNNWLVSNKVAKPEWFNEND